jgi:RNA polymerase sigma-70 factor (ECF subfamily)
MSDTTDAELVLQMQNGDLESLGVLYDRYRLMVFRTALAISGDQESANDLLQDVFLRLYRFADRIDTKRPIEPWLYRMTANLSYTWVKKNKRLVKLVDDFSGWISSSNENIPHECAERNDDWQWIQRAVLDLPFPQRVVVVLYYLNDLSLQEISEILEVPVGTIKSRLYYGRIALKKSLGVSLFGKAHHQPEFKYERT